jgi:hypothetical protein
MPVLAGQDGRPSGFAAMEITVPAHFAGPIPHAHDAFNEAIYVLSGHLLIVGDREPQQAGQARRSWRPAGNGTASAIHPPEPPLTSVSRLRPSPLWPSYATLAPRWPPVPHLTQTGCAKSTPGMPAACCPDHSNTLTPATKDDYVRWDNGSPNAHNSGNARRPAVLALFLISSGAASAAA